ncbi:DM DNA binding domain protein [Dirofilaria immitis]|nr:DM DNA binding domain protein [Dirofilaria immitis]
MSKEVNCQRYFATSKRVPKDVKRHCGMCRQHGMLIETRGHHCNRKNCNCSRCFLIRQRRQIMSTQIRIRRAQDKIFQRTSELTEATIIPQNCFDKSKSAEHKRHCLYANCTCNQCKLIEKRRKLDQILKTSKFKFNKNKKEQQIHIPISMNSLANSNMLSVLTNIDEQLTGQTHDEKLAEIPTPQSKSSSYTVNRVLLTSRFQSSSQTNISRVTFDESQESDTMLPAALAYPIPLKPQIFPLPIATVNMPAMCSFYSSTDALLNIRAMMQFALGFQ